VVRYRRFWVKMCQNGSKPRFLKLPKVESQSALPGLSREGGTVGNWGKEPKCRFLAKMPVFECKFGLRSPYESWVDPWFCLWVAYGSQGQNTKIWPKSWKYGQNRQFCSLFDQKCSKMFKNVQKVRKSEKK